MARGELKYNYVLNESGIVVNAKELTEQSKIDNKFYILGKDDRGNLAKEEVSLSICKDKQNYFRRFPVSSKNRQRILFTPIEYNETIIHRLAKQIINNKLKEINTPRVELMLNYGSITAQVASVYKKVYSKDEELFKSDSGNIIADVVWELGYGKKLVVEIYVSHKATDTKISILNKLNIDAIEINLSHMLNDSELSDKLEEQLTAEILNTDNIIWLNNIKLNKLRCHYNDMMKHVIAQKTYTTQYNKDKDGEWYIWAADRYNELKRCPYFGILEIGSYNKGNRMLTDRRHCSSCERFIGLNSQNVEQHAICYQGDYNDIITMRQIYYLYTGLIRND